MILYDNHKPLVLIGYTDSTITQEAKFWYDSCGYDPQVIEPDEFLSMPEFMQRNYQYGIAFTLDKQLRQKLLGICCEKDLNLLSYLHPTVVIGTNDARDVIAPGCFVAPYSTLLLGSEIGVGTIIETYCLISHHVKIAANAHLHSGVMIAGRTRIGNNSIFNFKSSVLNNLSLCDDIEVGAVSCVTKSITESGRYVGTPARKVSSSHE